MITLMLLSTLLLSGAGPALAQDCRDGFASAIPDPRFVIDQNGTVIDTATGLMWKQCTEGLSGLGCTVGSALSFNWAWAMRQGAGLTFAGHADWRLPDRNELQSLLRPRCHGLDIDPVSFPNTPAARFWSATPTPYYPGSAWTIHFGDGTQSYGTQHDSAYVRLVRDHAACSPGRPESCVIHLRTPAPPAESRKHDYGPLSPRAPQ